KDSSGKTYSTDVWPAVYDRILGVLSVAMEPLDIELIAQLGGINVERHWILQALDRLRQLLLVTNNRYGLAHHTIAEFLAAEKTRMSLQTCDLYQNPKMGHRRIAEYYLEKIRSSVRRS